MNYSEFDFTNGPLNNNPHVKQGDFLLAEPFLEDPNFARTVVLVCEHEDATGSFGLVVNRQTEYAVAEVVESLDVPDTLFLGGPVEQNTLHFIHRIEEVENSIALRDGVFWGGNYEQLKHFALQGRLNASNIRFFIGYSGWGSEQLRSEISQQSWIIATANLNHLFTVAPDKLWETTLKQMGGKYRLFSNYPTDPRLN